MTKVPSNRQKHRRLLKQKQKPYLQAKRQSKLPKTRTTSQKLHLKSTQILQQHLQTSVNELMQSKDD